jgi:aspartate-semialdehyde dehydrogenase
MNDNMLDVAVVGATGVVGATMLEILAERNFPVRNIYPLASHRSAGAKIRFNGRSETVQLLDEFDFTKAQVALFSAGGSVSEAFAPVAGGAGCVVIDNSSKPGTSLPTPIARPFRWWWPSNLFTTRSASSGSMSPPTRRYPAPASRQWMSWPGRRRPC